MTDIHRDLIEFGKESHNNLITMLAALNGNSNDQEINDTVEALNNLGITHNYLSIAKLFVIEVTPNQLSEIISSNLFKSIKPNREIKALA